MPRRKTLSARKTKHPMRESDSFCKDHTPQERLPHLVFISIHVSDGTWLSAFMTRVPCIGEHLANQGDVFKVVGVQHSLVFSDGKSRFGVQAILDVELVPESDTL